MRRVLQAVAFGVVAATAVGCGGAASPHAATPLASPVSLVSPATGQPTADAVLGGCTLPLLPSHYGVDKTHTGSLTAHTYSASADVQAALEYDQFAAGTRHVFIRHKAGQQSAVNGVVSCVAMRFATAPLAARFFSSYRALRQQAGSIVHRITPLAPVRGVTGTTAYFERQQSFRGYGITSTNVIEVAGLADRTLYIASVAGTSPSVALARTLTESMASRP